MPQDPSRPSLDLNLYNPNNQVQKRNIPLDELPSSDYLGEASEFGKSDYDNPLTPRTDIKSGDYVYNRGEQQNAALQMGAGILRTIGKAGIEMAKTPAYLYSLGEWSLDNIQKGGEGMSLADALDNSMIKALEGVEASVKETLPVYQSYKAGKGGLWDNIMSTSFWSSEGADGLGYLLGMMGTSGLLGTAKIGAKLGKLGMAKGVANTLDSGTQVMVNTMAESLAEAKGVVDKLKSDGATPEAIANAARETFLSNMILVAGPNALMHRNILGRFKNEKSILDDFRDASGKLVSNPVVKKELLKEYGKKIGYSMLSEGLVEEGGQSAIQHYEEKYALGKTKDGFFEGVAKEYIDGFSTLESQKAMLLGAVLGGIGGAFGQYQDNKSKDARKSAISDLIKKNYSSFNVTDNIYDTDESGAIKFNEFNEPIINPKALTKHIENIASMLKDSQIKDLAAFSNDKTLYDFISNKQFVEWALPFIAQGETGLEIANELIDQASNTQFLINQKELSESKGFQFEETQFKNEQKQLLKSLLKNYDRSLDVMSDIPLLNDLTKSNPKEANRFINQLNDTLFKEISKQEFYVKKLSELTNELNEFSLGQTADLPHNQKLIKKLQSDIEGINNLLAQSKDNYNKLFDESEIKEGWDNWLKDTVKEEKVVEQAAKTVEKTEKAEQKQREFNEGLEAQLSEASNTESLETFDKLFEKIKNNPYYKTEELNFLNKHRNALTKAIDVIAGKISKGELLQTPEELQFYENNKSAIEAKLQDLKSKKEAAPPTLSELTGTIGEDYYEGAEVKPSEGDASLVSETNSGIISDTDVTQKPVSKSKPDQVVTDKTLATQSNVVMMHLFNHYFDNNGNFRFKRNEEGQPDLDNLSKINIKVLNELQIGDSLELRLLPFEEDVLNEYKSLKDFDGENIGIFKDNELIGFVQQPHPIDTNVENVNKAEEVRNNLIVYRKKTINALKSGKAVIETVTEKGTGNLYTKLNKQGLIDPVYNVLNTVRPQDKFEGMAVFVYGNSDGSLTLPTNTELEDKTIKVINERLAGLRNLKTKPGAMFQLVNDLTGQLNVIPVYPNKIDSETAKAIDEVLKTHNNSSDPFQIIRELQPYIFAAISIKKGKTSMVVRKNDDNKIILLANGNEISLNEYNDIKEKRDNFLLGIKDIVKQNIDILTINTKVGQDNMTERNTLLTNVTTFEGEYFVQPYIAYTQSTIAEINNIPTSTVAEEQATQAVQPTNKPSSFEDKVKAKLNKHKDKSIDDDFGQPLETKEEVKVEQVVDEQVTVDEVKQIAKEEGIPENKVKEEIVKEVKAQIATPSRKERKGLIQKIINRIKKAVYAILFTSTIVTGALGLYSYTQGYNVQDIESFAERGLVKAGVIDVANEEKNIQTKFVKQKDTSNVFFEKIDVSKEGLLSYRNQWYNDNGFEYVPGVNNANFRQHKNEKYDNVVGVAHHLILLEESNDLTKYTSDSILKVTTNKILNSTNENDYIPIFTRLPNGNVKMHFDKVKNVKNNLKVNEFSPLRLRQTTVNDLDFNSEMPAEGFKKSIKAIKQKSTNQGFNSLVYAGNKNAYTKFSGGSVVLIFEYKGDIIVREFTGSINGIKSEIETVKSLYNVSENQITLGVFDAGSYTGKQASKDGTLSPKQWSGYNPMDKGGSSLMIPNNISKDNALSRTKDASKLNREQFKAYLAKNLPQLSLSDINSLNELKDTLIDAFGLFRDSTIYLFEGAGIKTAYHEAFHGVFRNLLTVEQREAIINEATKKYTEPTAKELEFLKEGLKGRYSTEQLTYLYYEEKLADDFAKYTYDRNDASLLTRVTKKIIDFFNKIFNLFRIFQTTNTTTIENVFNDVNTGKFATINSTSNSVVNRSLFNEYAYSRLDKQLGTSRKAQFTQSIGNELLARLQKTNFIGKDVSFLTLANDILNTYKEKLVETNDEKVEGILTKVILNYPELVNIEVKKYLAYRGLNIKGELKYNNTQEELIAAQQEGNIVTDNTLEPEKKADIEVFTLESKTTKSYGQEWTSISGVDSASKRIKLFLSSIPVIKDGKQLIDAFGIPVYHDFSSLYYYIESNLIDKYTFEEQIEKLEEISSVRPEIAQIVEMLTIKPSDMTQDEFTMLQNDFKANYSKQQLPYTLVLFNTDSVTGKVTYKIIDANRSAVGLELYNDWTDNLYDSTKDVIGKYDLDGNKVIDKEAAKKLLERWRELTKRKTSPKFEVVNDMLNKVGIEFSTEILAKLIKDNTELFKQNVENYLNFLSQDYSPAFEKIGRMALNNLVAEELAGNKDKYTSSFINNEGENIYTIQLPSYISKVVTKLTNLKKFKAYREEKVKDPYYRNMSILKDFDSKPNTNNYMTFANKAYRDLFKVTYLDGLKDEIGNKEGVSFTSMNPKDFMSMQLALFQNEGTNAQKAVSMPVNKYVYITPSDKTMCVMLDSTSYRATLAEDGINLDVEKSPILKAYYNVFLQEALRIRQALDLKNDILNNKGEGKYRLDSLLEHYHMSKTNFSKYSKLITEKSIDDLTDNDWENIATYFDGQAFKFNAFTDKYNNTIFKLFGDIIEESTVDNIKYNFEKYRGQIVDIINNQLKTEFADVLNEAVEKGLIVETKDRLYKNVSLQLTEQYDEEGTVVKPTEEVEHDRIINLILNYSLNSYLHNLEFSSLFNGDIAQYKPKDIQKRTYQSQAMIVDGHFENKTIKTLVVKDVIDESSTISNLRDELIKQGYSQEVVDSITKKYDENNVTDAQVFITPALFKRISQSRGIWDTNMQEAYDIADGLKEGNITESMRRLLTAFKPYYYGERFDNELGIYRYEQVKCSMLPLFKNYLDMNPSLASAYERMKTNQVDMLAFESSFKAAIGYRSDITDDTNGVYLDLNTDNFGIQVDNPDHMDDGNDSMRQLKMLILGVIDPTKQYNGKDGKLIIDELMSLEADNIESSLNDLMSKMDVKNNINFANFIKDMVTKRGATVTVETMLNVINGDFEYALDNGVASTQIENMISSVFTNNVIKQLFNVGGSAVQASSLGLEYSNLKEQQENLPEEAKVLQRKLQWIDSKDGKLTRVQTVMPAWTKDFFENGKLKDINNIPQELKQLIAYRIPTEGLHSMLSLEVVGFLPETMGNFILLPVEITTQLGADFDFDKIYFFGKEYYKDIDNDGNVNLMPFKYSEGKESLNERWIQYLKYTSMYQLPQKYNDIYDFGAAPIKEQNVRASRNNKIIENYDILLTSPENLELMITPSGFDELAKAKNYVITPEERYGKTSFFSSKTQRDLKERNHIGVALKGQWALHVTGHSYGVRMGLNTYNVTQEGELDRSKTVNFNGENRYDFSKMYTDNGNLISDDLAKILAGVLDDIKDPLLAYLGIDNNTTDVLATIIRAGYDLDMALYFGAQPALRAASSLLTSNSTKIRTPNQGMISIDSIITGYKAQAKAVFESLTEEEQSKVNIHQLNLGTLKYYAKYYKIINGSIKKGYGEENKLSYKTPTDFELYDYLTYQIKVLENFEIIKPIADELVKVNKFFAINKEVGPNIENIIAKRDILNEINKSTILHGFNINLIKPLKATWQAHTTALNWFESYFPYSTEQYERFKQHVVSVQTNKALNELPIEDRELMNHFVRIYVDTMNNDFFKSIPEEKPYLLFDLPKLIDDIKKSANVNKTLNGLTYGQIRENLFIQNIKSRFDKENKVKYLELKGNRLDLQVKNNVINSLKALYDNPNTKKLATDIIKHSYLTTGFYKGVKGFANLINPEILKDIDYNEFRKETIRNFKENTVYLTVEDIDFMTDQLIRNNPNKFTKKFDAEMFGLNKDKALPNEVKTDKNAAKEAQRLKDIYWTKTINQETIEVNPKYISIYDKTKRRTEIFELVEPFTWVKTSSLGKPNRLIEISPNKKPTGSILKNNNPVQEKVENSPKEVFKEEEEPLNEPAKANKSNSLFGDVFEPTDEDMNNLYQKEEGTDQNEECS